MRYLFDPKTKSVIFLIMILLFSLVPMKLGYSNIQANPLILMEEAIGGILTDTETSLQMIEASVLMNINESFKEEGDFMIFFDGNYTIYNPEETQKVTIAAPFYSYYDIEKTLRIEIEGIEKKFEITQLFPNKYEPLSMYGRKYAICDANITGYSNTSIRYTFDSEINRFSSSVKSINTNIYDAIMIIYDVGTAKAWDGVTTESVEFRIYGEQPTYFYNNTDIHDNLKFSVTNFTDSISYVWSWEETVIEDPWVFVEYIYESLWTPHPTSGYYFITTIIVLVILTIYAKFRIKD